MHVGSNCFACRRTTLVKAREVISAGLLRLQEGLIPVTVLLPVDELLSSYGMQIDETSGKKDLLCIRNFQSEYKNIFQLLYLLAILYKSKSSAVTRAERKICVPFMTKNNCALLSLANIGILSSYKALFCTLHIDQLFAYLTKCTLSFYKAFELVYDVQFL